MQSLNPYLSRGGLYRLNMGHTFFVIISALFHNHVMHGQNLFHGPDKKNFVIQRVFKYLSVRGGEWNDRNQWTKWAQPVNEVNATGSEANIPVYN